MISVVDELVGKVKLEPKVPYHGDRTGDEGEVLRNRKPCTIDEPIFGRLNVAVGAEHSSPYDV